MWRLERFFISFILIYCASSDQLFTSVVQMENLLADKSKLVSLLNNYLQEEYSRLDEIESKLKHVANNFNLSKSLHHPIDQFHFIKQMIHGRDTISEIVTSVEKNSHIFNTAKFNLPDEKDLSGAAESLLRLQRAYHLDSKLLASGIVKNLTANQPLTADDCYYIGQVAFQEEDFNQCHEWVSFAFNTGDFDSSTKIEEYISDCASKSAAVESFNETAVVERVTKIAVETATDGKNDDELLDLLSVLISETYEKFCRSPPQLPVTTKSELKCYYWTNDNKPRLLIRPAQVEVMYLSPAIIRFYDVISDKEIMTLQNLARPLMNRSGIVCEGGDSAAKLNRLRVSQTAWVGDSASSVVAGISQRIADITGLSMETAEDYQVVNYGVGGQYEPHYDCNFDGFEDLFNFSANMGNRLATFLLYLSDVPYGGSTVFLEPEVSARPIKGSAVFWYNLRANGDADERSIHGACPVLVGNKWVANKWIHERGQHLDQTCKPK